MQNAKFVVYAYYPRPADAVALEFWTKIAELHAHFAVEDRFKFIPIFTQEGGKRLTQVDIFATLRKHHDHSGIKNMWVCGPPTMNNMFQEAKSKICKQFGIQLRNIDIL
jgi:NAD(P)H-flavin reductase